MLQDRNSIGRFIHSPTTATWLFLLSKSANALMVLPFVLGRFSPEETAVWLLLVTVNGLQLLFDIGFTPTFTRYVSYLNVQKADGRVLELVGLETKDDYKIAQLRAALMTSIKIVFAASGVLGAVGVAVVGGLAVRNHVAALAVPSTGWTCVLIIVPSWSVQMVGRTNISLLEGTGRLADVRRWAAVFSASSGIAGMCVLLLGGGLVPLMLATEIVRCANVLWNRVLANKIRRTWSGGHAAGPPKKLMRRLLASVWSRGWRSGLGILLNHGVVQLTGIVYAQIGDPVSTVSYLLAMRLLDFNRSVSNAPFYSQLPRFAQLYSKGQLDTLGRDTEQRMRWSLGMYGLGFAIGSLAGPTALRLINSSVSFPDQWVWSVLGIAFLFDRAGAMHIQSYTLSNHVVWHKIASLAGLATIIGVALLGRPFGALGFAVAIAISSALVYYPYGAILHYRFMGMCFPQFEIRIAWVAAILVLFGVVGLHALRALGL